MQAHEVEPYTHDQWMCVTCGNLFQRTPECEQCKHDPFLLGHTCEFESAFIEGDCQPYIPSKEEINGHA